jgi:hypothetical protein
MTGYTVHYRLDREILGRLGPDIQKGSKKSSSKGCEAGSEEEICRRAKNANLSAW